MLQSLSTLLRSPRSPRSTRVASTARTSLRFSALTISLIQQSPTLGHIHRVLSGFPLHLSPNSYFVITGSTAPSVASIHTSATVHNAVDLFKGLVLWIETRRQNLRKPKKLLQGLCTAKVSLDDIGKRLPAAPLQSSMQFQQNIYC